MHIWLVLALICLLAGLIAQYTFRLKEPLFLHYSQSAYLGCGLDGVETSEDGIVSSVSSEALEEESTDSDVKVGVLDEGMKDLNADMGLENTVSLYALGEESVDETDETSDVWYTQVNFAYLTDVTDEIFAQVKKLLYECWKCEKFVFQSCLNFKCRKCGRQSSQRDSMRFIAWMLRFRLKIRSITGSVSGES